MASKSSGRAVLAGKLLSGLTSLFAPLNWLPTGTNFRGTGFGTRWKKT